MKRVFIALTAWGIGTLVSCTGYKNESGREQFIRGSDRLVQSTTAGNLIATAIREAAHVDMVFYPSRILSKEGGATLSTKATAYEKSRLLGFYPDGPKDKFITGTMTGAAIREFIYARSRESYEMDLEVAGLEYDINFVGGYPQYSYVSREYGLPLEDQKRYRVALSEYFYFSGETFPAYKYRNSITFTFAESARGISAREALEAYMKRHEEYTGLDQIRARVRTTVTGDAGFLRIHDIQGSQHRSKYYGQKAVTEGIVTAVGSVSWYPGGTDFYIQDPEPDGDDKTSEGLYVHLRDGNSRLLRLGDKVRVSGVVYERLFTHGLGKTGLLEVSQVDILAHDQPLPPAVKLGAGGRELPKGAVSTFHGDLNFKTDLTLTDGIDFWESLEGMRVQIENPRIVSFRGGQEAFVDRGPKSYLSLYMVPNGDIDHLRETPAGGIVIDSKRGIFNPQILQLQTNHLSVPINVTTIFRVGDIITGPLEGVLGYEENIFGDGEYALVLPQRQPALDDFVHQANADPLRAGDGAANLTVRPQTSLLSSPTGLTVATFNIKNLSGNTPNRVTKLSEAISNNLHCPDIVNLPEVQDSNGPDFSDGSSAEETLTLLVKKMSCPFKYSYLNIDPVNNDEGGQPGGNIRVAMLYNPERIHFSARPPPSPLTDAVIDRDGNLNFNPGRVAPNDKIFTHTRRSLVAQFEFRGKKIFLIGNHFNSKLGDSSVWSAQQPAIFESETKRSLLADRINDFVELLARRAPDAYILVLGDFNAYISENAMSVLEGENLKNLMTLDSLIPPQNRYTIAYNGSAQAIDFIFASKNLLGLQPQLEIVHLNTGFMGQIADHDPVVSRFEFP